MSDERQEPVGEPLVDTLPAAGTLGHELITMSEASCQLSAPLACRQDAEGHCVTCSDEALPARVLRVDLEMGLALVEVKDTTEEIDVTLVDDVVPGAWLLVHGGVAIGHLDEMGDK